MIRSRSAATSACEIVSAARSFSSSARRLSSSGTSVDMTYIILYDPDMSAVISDKQATKHIAHNIRLRLSDMQMSQAELARRSKSSAMRISLYARGIHMPGSGVLSRIASALSMTADELLAEPTE